jgi:hypothetical protein
MRVRRLATKPHWRGVFCEITGIPSEALRNLPMSRFSVDERMSWAESRQASREEDRAYCMLGIFGVQMPLIYGEGMMKAFARLQREIHESEREREKAAGRQDDESSDESVGTEGPWSYYHPLGTNGFRLLVLEPGNFGSDIKGYIREFDLLDAPQYYALSYVWGQEPALHRIFIDNTITFIRPNLFHAIQRIRASHKTRLRLWVDSISINQWNDTERNAQVRRMAQIYNKAAGVFVWLGEEDATSKLAMELVERIYRSLQEPLKDPDIFASPFSWDGAWWKQYAFTALSLLLERPWFRRGWVLQEAAFSTNSLIQCGDKQLHMDTFTAVTNLVRSRLGDQPQATRLLANRMQLGTLMNSLDSPAVRMLDLIQDAFRRSAEGVILGHTLPLETLVHKATFSEVSDARDTIYALLNMANDQGSIPMSNRSNTIVPDYRKSVLSVYADFILHCCYENESLDVLYRPWAPVPSSRQSYNTSDDEESMQLPSWIYPRDSLPYGEPSWRSKHRLHRNPLVGSGSKRMYNAHAGTKPTVLKGPTSDRPHRLVVKGMMFTKVIDRSARMANAIVTRQCLLLGDRKISDPVWWRILCAGRDGGGNTAPESWKAAMDYLLKTPNLDTTFSIDIEEILDSLIPEQVRAYLTVVRDIVWNRRTFCSRELATTGENMVGLVPPGAKIGDHICILYGCSVPVVLRKQWDNEEGQYWQLVGDVYVDGIMEGEAISGASQEMLDKMEVDFEIR